MTALALAAALLESDRRYFELGATVEEIEGAEVAWMPGMEATPAGCVVHRVRPSVIGVGGSQAAAGAVAAAWVADVTRRLRGLGCGLARVYLDRADADLDRALAGAGYRARVETGFLVEGALPAGPRSDVAVREIVDDDGWEAKAKLHAGSDVAADGHASQPEEWVEFERRKCATGGMRAFLVEVDGEVCGAVATLEGDGLLRAKNVFVHADRRREGIAAESLRVLSRRAVDLGLAATGIFGVDGRPGAAVYVHLRMTPVVSQVEWVAAPLTLAERYRDDGYVLVRGLFGADEVAAWVGECDRLEASGVMHPDNLRTHVLNSTRPPDRLDPVVDLSPVLRSLAGGLASLAGELLGEEAALFKDKLIFKPPGMRGYLAHQDYAYWHWLPVPPSALVTVLVALDGATVENGAVELFAGFHDRLLTEEGRPADVPDGVLPEAGFLAETAPGDVVVFHSLTPHRSGDNRTAAPRRQLFLSYSAARYGDLYRTYYEGLQASVVAALPAEARSRAYFR